MFSANVAKNLCDAIISHYWIAIHTKIVLTYSITLYNLGITINEIGYLNLELCELTDPISSCKQTFGKSSPNLNFTDSHDSSGAVLM